MQSSTNRNPKIKRKKKKNRRRNLRISGRLRDGEWGENIIRFLRTAKAEGHLLADWDTMKTNNLQAEANNLSSEHENEKLWK